MTRTSLRLDVEEWAHELTYIWKPTRVLEVRNEGTLGLLFIAQVRPSLTLHLRIQWNGVDTCALWQGKHYVLWDRAIGFCAPPHPSPVPKEQEEWQTQMRALIRRNCFLMGCDVWATDEEKHRWLHEREDSKTLEPPQTSASTEAL